MIQWFIILEGMTLNYFYEHFVKADTPYDTRDKCNLIQPLKKDDYRHPTFFLVLQCTYLEYAPHKHKSSAVNAWI